MNKEQELSLCKIKKSALETLQMIQNAYGSSALSWSDIYQRYAPFHECRKDMKDNATSGCRSTSAPDEQSEAVQDLLFEDCHNSLWITAEFLNIGKDSVHMIVEQNLGHRKMCTIFVPPALMLEPKQERVMSIPSFHDRRLKFQELITGDNSLCFEYNPIRK